MTADTTPVSTPSGMRPAIPRPEKPWADFPLYWHPRGYWMCKRGGQELRYEADAHRSYERFRKDMDSISAGAGAANAPRRRFLMKDAVNLYLTRQKRRMDEGDLGPVQFTKCRTELERRLPKAISLRTPLDEFRAGSPDDARPSGHFHRIRKTALRRGLHAAHRHITIVRAALDYAVEKKLMLPPDYADDFNPPSSDRMDRQRHEADAEHGERSWSVPELRMILGAAAAMRTERRAKVKGNLIKRNHHLYAQILLGLFAGFGSDDCSAVTDRAIDFEKGIIRFPRVKNGRPRMAALPTEVLDAIRHSLAHRAKASGESSARLLFRTIHGGKCNLAPTGSDDQGIIERIGRNDTIGQNFKRLVNRLGLQRHRAGFKTLRAMCRTLMVGSGIDSDLTAVIMGRNFRFEIDDYYIRGDLREKLFAASEHIKSQLFPTEQTQ